MTILVDPPQWWAHGRRWSHLVSDSSMAELHTFARGVGIPERSFEGDHYDVPEDRYAEVVTAGALEVRGTELARRLRDSGLRFRKRRGERPLARIEDGLGDVIPAPHVLDVVASPHERPDAGAAVVLIRAGTLPAEMVMVRSASRAGWAPPGGKVDPGERVRDAAVREVAEETGLVLDPAELSPAGYERITVPGSPLVNPRPFRVGTNHLQVFAALVSGALPLRPDLEDVLEAAWFTRAQAAGRSGDRPWWPLVEWWWERR